MKTLVFISVGIISFFTSFNSIESMKIERSQTIDSLGACQGVSIQNNRIFLYGDREVGMIREYKVMGDSLVYVNKEMRLTLNDSDIINHPTGIAYQPSLPVFIGNSIRLNKEGTKWKAVIYCIDWKGLQHSGKLDGNLLNTIDDDTCIQGTRPEYVQYQNKWFVATADYGNKSNEVRLYDPSILKTTQRTSAKGVLYKKFSCSPWVQNLFWIADKGILVLIQNQIEGRKWRFTYVDLEKSILSGKESVIKVIDINERNDELEGFAFLNNSLNAGVAVTSSRVNNVNKLLIK
jgi:phage gpG-like protein